MKKRNINIDLLRIFAAFMVLSVHVGQHSGFDFSVGAKGVQLFFVLRGYLAFASLEKNDLPIAYYKSRLIRILPTYYFCLVLVYAEDIVLAIHDGNLHEILAGQCSFRFLRYVFFLQCFLPSDDWDMWNNHSALWTMSAFVGFYIVAPWLHKLVKNIYNGMGLLFILLISRPWLISLVQKLFVNYPEEAHIEWFAEANPLSELYCFMLGAVLFLAIKQSKHYMYLLMLVLCLIASSLTWYNYEIVFVVLVALCAMCDNITDNAKIQNVIKWLGAGSFTLYLIHPLVLAVEGRIWALLGYEDKILHALALYLACFILSYLIYYCFISKIEQKLKMRVR